MNSFNKTEAAVFSCRLCFLRAFPFVGLIFWHCCGFSVLVILSAVCFLGEALRIMCETVLAHFLVTGKVLFTHCACFRMASGLALRPTFRSEGFFSCISFSFLSCSRRFNCFWYFSCSLYVLIEEGFVLILTCCFVLTQISILAVFDMLPFSLSPFFSISSPSCEFFWRMRFICYLAKLAIFLSFNFSQFSRLAL